MGFWTAITVISVVAIATEFVLRVVKLGTRFSENVERIKHGYPTIDGAVPIKSDPLEPTREESDKAPQQYSN